MTLTVDDIAEAVVAAFPKLTPLEQHTSLATYRLLALGQPVAPKLLAAESGVPPDALARMLETWHGVERNAAGAVTAFWGLTLATTKHRFRAGGVQLFTWCAWDTLFLPDLLGTVADVESECPVTRRSISLKVAPGGVLSAAPASLGFRSSCPPKRTSSAASLRPSAAMSISSALGMPENNGPQRNRELYYSA